MGFEDVTLLKFFFQGSYRIFFAEILSKEFVTSGEFCFVDIVEVAGQLQLWLRSLIAYVFSPVEHLSLFYQLKMWQRVARMEVMGT